MAAIASEGQSAEEKPAPSRWQRFVDWRASRHDPRWRDAHDWSDTDASGFRTPARVCPRGCSHEVARRELLAWSGWSGRAIARVLFEFETTNCHVCGLRRVDRCPRCTAKVVAPVADRCEYCGLPQPWAPDRLTATRRTPPRQWELGAPDPARPLYGERGKRQLLVIDHDITNVAVDAIVSNDDVQGHMYTVIASAIKAAAGRQVEDESIDHGRSALGSAWFTRPGRLNRLKGIIHVAAMDRRGETNLGVITECVRKALDQARKHECASVAIAAFGTEPPVSGRTVIELGSWLDAVAPEIVSYLDGMPDDEELAVLLVLYEQADFERRVRDLARAVTRRRSRRAPLADPRAE